MSKQNTKKFISKILLFQVLCAGVAISLGIMIGVNWEISKYNNRFYKNIAISNVDVSNKTKDEAIFLLKTAYLDKFLESDLSVLSNNQTFKVPIKTFYAGSDLNEIVSIAFAYQNELMPLEKYQLLLGKSKKNFDITIDFDNKAIDTFVENILAQTTGAAQNAMISISNNKESLDNVKINITPHVPGSYIDKEQLTKKIELALNRKIPLMIDATPFTIKKDPTITTESLQVIDSLIASTATVFTPNTGTATNIGLSAKVINGTLLMPGDIFSFNEIIGETTLEKGYAYAPSIINSKYVQDVGGGVCQVSSTLYNTALQVGLDSLSRRPHSKPTAYLPLGLDATISWGHIDYQFKNTLNYPIYIEAYTKENKLYVNMYSNHKLKEIEYKIKSEVYQTLPSPIQYITDPTLPKGFNKLIQSGEKGYKVKVIREAYEKDVLKDIEVISYDTYKAIPTIYKIGKEYNDKK